VALVYEVAGRVTVLWSAAVDVLALVESGLVETVAELDASLLSAWNKVELTLPCPVDLFVDVTVRFSVLAFSTPLSLEAIC